MPESKMPDKEKQPRNRSYGSFLLFLSILVVILFVVGRSSFPNQKDLTQDEYLAMLYTGRVQQQEIKGTNRIAGRLSNGEFFVTRFTDLASHEKNFQQLKAIPRYEKVTEARFRQAVTDGDYAPQLLRLITEYKEAPQTKDAPETTPVAKSLRDYSSQIFVEVIARADQSDSPLSLGNEAPLPRPKSSGPMWLEIRNTDDVAVLMTDMKALGAQIDRHYFDITSDRGTTWTDSSSLLSTALFVYGPWLVILFIVFYAMRQMRGQGGAGGVMSFGRSRAQLYTKENNTNVTFNDVAGAEEAKEEVEEVVEFLKNPGRFTRIGGRIPRGILLVGQPGCGKTLLAKAIAGEAEVPFFSISGSDFVEMFVGVGASRVRDLFKQARENSPSIIFLDEIDAVGRRRGSGMGGGHDEREQTLNAILVEMDGFGTDEGIIIIAATNRPDVLDPALLRPGRFDRSVTIELPDMVGREAILKVHLGNVKAGKDIDMAVLAKSTPGYSGADLAATVNEAAIGAVLNGKDEVAMEHLEEARDKVRYGRERKSRKLLEADRSITAYHESGHALVAAEIECVDPPHKVTIVPRGRALGATMMLPTEESYHMQKRRMVGQLAVLFGGRAAEEVFCGDISAGASDDIKRATELARAMVTELGMSEVVGPINYAERQGSDFLGTELGASRWHSEETSRQIDEEVQKFLRDAYARALDIVNSGKSKVENLTQALLRYETLNVVEIEQIFSGTSLEDLRPDPDPEPEASPETPQADIVKKDSTAGTQDLGDLPGGAAPSPA
ncbi:MAG: cell division protease FtsH [Candidatus Paceibacteria bacterium]|jgi:cell division protease FtsH